MSFAVNILYLLHTQAINYDKITNLDFQTPITVLAAKHMPILRPQAPTANTVASKLYAVM